VFEPADAMLEGPITNYLNNYGLEPVVNILDQIFEYTNYMVVDVIFDYLSGDLIKDMEKY
jgi:hypothetical protein